MPLSSDASLTNNQVQEDIDGYLDHLYQLHWHRLSLELTNTRNVFAREHPLSIFEAVFKRARTLPGSELDIGYVFRPRGYRLPERIQKNRTYPLALVFFGADLPLIYRFLANLERHLSDRRNNFSLRVTGPPEQRNLADLLREAGSLPANQGELCLEFFTPFPFRSAARNRDNSRYRRILLSSGEFFEALCRRVEQAFGVAAPATSPWAGSVRVLPYYWQYVQYKHRAKSVRGHIEYINGAIGPLYLKGDVRAIHPLLLLCAEINASTRTGKGRGAFKVVPERPFFDLRLTRFSTLRKAMDRLQRECDLDGDMQLELIKPDLFLRQCFEEICSNGYQPSPFCGFTLPKKKGGTRLIASARPRDRLVLRMLHDLLAPVLDKMFEDCSIGFRRGRSRSLARKAVAGAVRDGYTHVLEADIASFFDDIDWELMEKRLRDTVPLADRLTLALLSRFIRAELEINNRPVERDRGLIQGMALSPLLANLYLDTFDEEMSLLGYFLVRYGDDFVVMARGQKEAEQARVHAAAILERLHLRLNTSKTTVTAFDAGFSFLGFDFGPGLDEEFIDRTALRKTVFVRSMFGFIGVDSDTLVIRKDKRLVAGFPLNRVGELVIFGDNTLSARLVHRCCASSIPISFCRAGGRYVSTLRPDSKSYFALTALHDNRFSAMDRSERTTVARRIVTAKIRGYIHWLAGRYTGDAAEICATLENRLARLDRAETVESLRGYEGEAAGQVYAFLRTVIRDPFFLFSERRPREKCDPFNVLTDFASFLMFSRINVLLRGQGLNPYLGFLHSHRDNYESLVCDLQEPFRARTDRFVMKTMNRRMIRPEHFHCDGGRYSLTSKAVGIFLEAFEKEQQTRLRGDGGTLKQLLVAQVQAVRMWAVDSRHNLVLYQPDTRL